MHDAMGVDFNKNKIFDHLNTEPNSSIFNNLAAKLQFAPDKNCSVLTKVDKNSL